MAEHLFDEMKRYVAFDAGDEARLRETARDLAPHFTDIVDVFYERLEQHAGARAVAERFSTIDRLKKTFHVWLEGFFAGPWDHAYFERRARIGRRHVEIGLPQHYMLTGMQVLRRRMSEHVLAASGDADRGRMRMISVNKLLDLELGIMLHTYREDYLSERQRYERLATFGLLTSTIAHELRNPLAVIDTSLYLLKDQIPESGEGRRHLDKIQAQVRRSNRLIANLLDLVRDRPPHTRQARPALLAEQAVRAMLDERGVGVVLHVSEDLPDVDVDADQIHQILLNLLANAVDATGTGEAVRLDVEAEGEHVRFVVSDAGPGIDPSVATRLFEPLVTTKDHGVGLGLALCRKLAAAHGGRVTLGERRLEGATFVLDLPACRA